MAAITTLGTLMGISFVSGMRLYSTVLAVGLGLRFGFLELPESLEQLSILASTPVLAVAGTIYAIEFLADKVPWVDSLWDAIHTLVRPLGAAILASVALGSVDPTVQVGAFLLGGTVALSSHTAKAGTRLAVNHSPEPFTNVALSLSEDALVVGGTWLALTYPVITLVLVVALLAVIAWLIPKLFRLFRGNVSRLVAFARGQAVREGNDRIGGQST